MAKTGPQKYPPASLKYFYQGAYPGDAMESNVGVLHTTEGRTLPSYGGGASAPNFTAVPNFKDRRLDWYQHFDFDVSSRALVNRAGGVETNTANAVQVELVGTCDERKAESWDGKRAGVDYLFWPDAPDWALAGLAEFVKWCRDNHGVKAQSTVTWKAYKKGQVGGSYGANGVRLTGAQWGKYYGWLGHQHVPENDHGDPGDLDFARVLQLTIPPKPLPTPVEPPTPGVPMTAPSRLSLSRSEDVTLVPGTPYTVYWTGETVDDGNEHGAGGKTVATNVAYSAVVRVQIDGLETGEYVDVLPIELNSSGAEIGYGAAIQLDGRTGSVVSRSAAFMGHMGQGLAFKVINRGAQVVDMTAIELQAHLWPNPA